MGKREISSTARSVCLWLLVATFCLPVFATDKPHSSASSIEKVRLQLKWFHQFQFAGYYAALEQGFYAEEGLDVDIVERDISKGVVDQLVAGEADYGIEDSGLLVHYAQGQPIKLMAAIYQHSPLAYFALKKSGIVSPYEMVGKTVMSDLISANDTPLLLMLNNAGIVSKGLNLVQQNNNYSGLISGEVDVISGYITDQPFYYTKEQAEINIINPVNYGIDFYGDMLFTTEREALEHPERVQRFLRASLKGWKYALDHPEQLIKLISEKYKSQLSIEHLRFESEQTKSLILADRVPLGQVDIYRLAAISDSGAKLDLQRALSTAQLEGLIFRGRSSTISLTNKEQEWLSNHPTISVGVDRDFAPYEWVDEQGKYRGMAADYLALIAKKLGVNFKVIGDKSWSDILTMAQQGELDMLSAAARTPAREQYLNYVKPYKSAPVVVINNDATGFLGGLESLEGKSIAIEKGYFMEELLRSKHPNIKLLVTSGTLQALQAVIDGKADGYVGDAGIANYLIRKEGLFSLRFAGQTSYTSEQSIAVTKGNPELYSIMKKAMDSITPEEADEIFNRWLGLKIEQGIHLSTIIKYAVAVALFFLLFLLWVIRLRGEVRKRIEAENQLLESEEHLKIIIGTSPACIKLVASDGELLEINSVGLSMMGAEDQAEVIGQNVYSIIAPEDRSRFQAFNEFICSGQSGDLTFEIIGLKGERVWMETHAAPLYLKSREELVQLGITQNVTERRKIEMRERSRFHTLELITKGATLTEILEEVARGIEQGQADVFCSISLVNSSGTHLVQTVSPRLPAFYLEATKELKIGKNVGSCGAAAYSGSRVIAKEIQNHPNWLGFKKLAAKSGLVACWAEPIFSSENQLLGTIAIYHKTVYSPDEESILLIEQAARLASIAIEKSKMDGRLQLAASVFTHAREGIIITDAENKIIDINTIITQMTGYSREELIGVNPHIFKSEKQSPQFYEAMWNDLEEDGHWSGELWNRHKNGELFAEMKNISVIKDKDGNVLNYVSLCTDITAIKKHQEQLEKIAHYDILTTLPNRVLLADRLNQAMLQCKRKDKILAVLFIDLDGFKAVNDTYGHEVGDELLVVLSRRMSEVLRVGDTLARIGGDEFVAILTDLDEMAKCDLVLSRVLGAASSQVQIMDHLIQISASIGVTVYPQDSSDADLLMRHADQAMYIAKQMGKNQYHWFDTAQDIAVTNERKNLKNIKDALESNQFVLFYQPKINMQTGKVFGCEALIRWLHPERGLIPPLEFLPVLASTDLEIEVGCWVMNTAIEQLNDWHQQGLHLEVSINISSYHLQSPHFYEQLKTALDRYPEVKPEYLQLEILESSALGDIRTVSYIIKNCQESLGVNIALDDFGTGYSSLTHLRNLPAQTIKIDQSFIRDMLDDPDDCAIIDGVIGLAKSFNRDIIAEGVETTEHGLMLLTMGCSKAQGYGVARPMPAEDLQSWLEAFVPEPLWINYANQKRTVRDDQIKQLYLTGERWFLQFKCAFEQLSEADAHWPILEKNKSHTYLWLKRAEQEQFFEPMDMMTLFKMYENINDLANKVYHLSQSAEKQKAQAVFEEMESVYLRFIQHFKYLTTLI